MNKRFIFFICVGGSLSEETPTITSCDDNPFSCDTNDTARCFFDYKNHWFSRDTDFLNSLTNDLKENHEFERSCQYDQDRCQLQELNNIYDS